MHIVIRLYSILVDIFPCSDVYSQLSIEGDMPCRKRTELGVRELQRLAGGPERVDGLRELRSMRAILRLFEGSWETIVS